MRLVILLSSVLAGVPTAGHAQADPLCKTVTSRDGSGVDHSTVWCFGPDGRWKMSAAPSSSGSAQNAYSNSNVTPSGSDIIPPDFRGQITYEGTVEGTATVRGNGGVQFNVGGFRGSIPTTQDVAIHSTYHGTLTFDGANVRGVAVIRGSFNGQGNFSGTRQGDVCSFVAQDGLSTTARCSLTSIVSDQDYSNPQGQHIRTHTEAMRTAMVDYAERDRQAAAAKAASDAKQAAARAEQARKDAEFAAYLKSRPAANTALVNALGQAIAQDSSAWSVNRYDGGSLNNVVVLKSAKDGFKTLRGNYTYNGGTSGWVQAQVKGGKVQCLEYWDNGGSCVEVRYAVAPASSTQRNAIRLAAKNTPNIDLRRYVPLVEAEIRNHLNNSGALSRYIYGDNVYKEHSLSALHAGPSTGSSSGDGSPIIELIGEYAEVAADQNANNNQASSTDKYYVQVFIVNGKVVCSDYNLQPQCKEDGRYYNYIQNEQAKSARAEAAKKADEEQYRREGAAAMGFGRANNPHP